TKKQKVEAPAVPPTTMCPQKLCAPSITQPTIPPIRTFPPIRSFTPTPPIGVITVIPGTVIPGCSFDELYPNPNVEQTQFSQQLSRSPTSSYFETELRKEGFEARLERLRQSQRSPSPAFN